MENIINNIVANKYIYIGALLLILIIIVLIALRPKKVKPIEITKDDEVKNEPKSEIEKVIEALEENKVERPMTTFEEEQEANAIISYQELVKAVEEKRSKYDTKPAEIISQVETPSTKVEDLFSSIISKDIEQPTVEVESEVNESPITLDIDPEMTMNIEPEIKVETTINTLDIEPENDMTEEKKFKNSEFISPIFGKDGSKTSDDFLKELKDFRSNL